MGYWKKIPNRPKSQKFRCSKCGRTCTCIKYEGHRTVCDYKYCPYCREPMESEGVGMTREKAIEVLNTYDMSEDNEDTEFKDALALAIKALEQEPCEDAVSRAEVLNLVRYNAFHVKSQMKAIENMLPVEPTRKWVPVSEKLPKEDGDYLLWGKVDEDEDEYAFIGSYDSGCEEFGIWQEQFDRTTLGCIGSDFFEYASVVAWMPLPDPYKTERGE